MSNFNLNSVVIAGRVCTEIEYRQLPNGCSVANFTVAVNRKKTAGGETPTDFIRCSAWDKTAEFVSEYFRKGMAICVMGELRYRTRTDKEGKTDGVLEVKGEKILFVDSKAERERGALNVQAEQNGGGTYTDMADGGGANTAKGSVYDDSLPF